MEEKPGPKSFDDAEPLLRVSDLAVRLGRTLVLDRISFEIGAGEMVALLGESGAGKTTLARAIIGLLPEAATAWGSIAFAGRELLGAGEREWLRVRGSGMTMIRQEPELGLHPMLSVARQIDEVLVSHRHATTRQERRLQVERALTTVGLSGSDFGRAYPHQLSGGQRQRVVIAQALAARPALLIADEPTSSLDTITARGILDLLRKLKAERRLALLFITHNPELLAGWTDRTLRLEKGALRPPVPAAG